MLFTWEDIYETGIEEVDNQHMELFESANKLYELVNKEINTYQVREVLDFLCKYTINHFDIEEDYQQRINYPKINEHKQMHAQFTKELTDRKNDIEVQLSRENIEKLSRFVIDWLKEHIIEVDKEMSFYVIEADA